MSLQNLTIALVHDWLNQLGGAENVLEELVALFPGAPIYTSMYAAKQMPAAYRQWPIRTSFMQQLPGVTKRESYATPAHGTSRPGASSTPRASIGTRAAIDRRSSRTVMEWRAV